MNDGVYNQIHKLFQDKQFYQVYQDKQYYQVSQKHAAIFNEMLLVTSESEFEDFLTAEEIIDENVFWLFYAVQIGKSIIYACGVSIRPAFTGRLIEKQESHDFSRVECQKRLIN